MLKFLNKDKNSVDKSSMDRIFYRLIIWASVFYVPSFVYGAGGVPGLIPFQGRLTDVVGNPVSTQVEVKFRLYPPPPAVPMAECYVYEETQQITPNSYGLFSTTLGSGASTGPSNTLVKVFSNDPSTPLSDSCSTQYTPVAHDYRRVEVVVNGVPMGDMQVIGSSAYAFNTETLQGLSANQFIQVSSDITQANISKLVDGSDASSLHNHDSQYVGKDSFNNISSIGNITSSGNISTSGTLSSLGGISTSGSLATDKWLGLGKYSDTDEASPSGVLYSALGAAGASAVGRMWVNTTTNELKYWDGTSVQTVSSGAASNYVSKSGDTMTGALNLPTGGLAVGTDQLTVKADGKVGIGTTSPNEKLHVFGGASFAEDATQGFFISGGVYKNLTLVSNGQYGDYSQMNSGGNPIVRLGSTAPGGGNGSLDLSDSGSAKVHLIASGDSYLNGGNVGINNATPKTLLDINGATPGTITTSGTAVTGIGTNFLKDFKPGDKIWARGDYRIVSGVSSNTAMTLQSGFSPDISPALEFTKTAAKIKGTVEIEVDGLSSTGGSAQGMDVLVLRNNHNPPGWSTGSALRFETMGGVFAGRLGAYYDGGTYNHNIKLSTNFGDVMVWRYAGQVAMGNNYAGPASTAFLVANEITWPAGPLSVGTLISQKVKAHSTDPGVRLIGLQVDPQWNDNGNTGVKHIGLAVNSGNVGLGTDDPDPNYRLHVIGDVKVQGSHTTCTLGDGSGGTSCSSDIRLKTEISEIPNALEKILSLRGVEFKWNEKSLSPGKEAIGVIAQEVERSFPTAVTEDQSTGYKKVDYSVLVAPLIQAVKELNQKVEDLFTQSFSQNKKQDERIAKIEDLLTKTLDRDRELAEQIAELQTENERLKSKLPPYCVDNN